MKKDVLVTTSGLQKLKKDLETKKEKLAQMKNLLAEMVQAGDLSENDGYTLALENSLVLEGEVFKLNDMISNAKVSKGKTKGKIEIGDGVKVKDEKGKIKTYTIVGENEADPTKGKISYKSPIGAAIMGKKKGDKVEITTPSAKIKYDITEILD
ncbi:GreA/GreB family elongation factor [Candidatus Dojkabacteria bacterium]|jgi:transcription elongation factor GreA|nr:GreA/GreB family elongation factor [Candidatus Dojkabacteria bacterium]